MNPRPDFFKHKSFIEILLAEFSKREARRHGTYSIRAFALDLELSPSTLHDVLNGRYGISNTKARKIAEKLGFAEDEADYFCDLVRAKHSRSSSERQAAKTRLMAARQFVADMEKVPDEQLDLFSRWYYPAVLELVTLKKGLVDPEIVSRTFKIDIDLASESLEHLVELKLLSFEDGRYHRQKELLYGERNTPTQVIREFHKQMLTIAAEKVDEQSIFERKSLSTVFSFNTNQIEEAMEDLEKIHHNFRQKFESDKGSDKVYAVTMHLFSLGGK